MDILNPDWVPSRHLQHEDTPAIESPHQFYRRFVKQQKKRSASGQRTESQTLGDVTSVDKKLVNKTQAAQKKEAEDRTEALVVDSVQVVNPIEVSGGVEKDEEVVKDVEPAQESTSQRQESLYQFLKLSSCEELGFLLPMKELCCELHKNNMDESFFKDNAHTIEYYTGMPSLAIFMLVLDDVKPSLPVSKLSPFQMVLLTLARLRLGISVEHLAQLLEVSSETIYTAFTNTVDVLYSHLNSLVLWPKRHRLQAMMPRWFLETFGKRVAIIVDCFQMHIERQSRATQTHRQSWSSNKSTHSVKYLLGITTQGAIVFISKEWGSCASDIQVTENCGLLDELLPGDIVLSDRGFDIKDNKGLWCAEVKSHLPSKKRCLLDPKNVENTPAMAKLKNLVKGVIDGVRNKSAMLHNRIPANLFLQCTGEEVTFLYKIVSICCTVSNMCPSVNVTLDGSKKCAH
ncbi:uncharacterized protein LOC129192222 isoform X2 [Dunckerocampus dactyliophorus]|nr:uncharacterized protein LOC129192222 isoform X2 [Dunckerocampus dactyliophorus]XP_054651979.1 uncharacterized protein LOC129192222 isoform X2 [Dunckerocampus dactyliophorus]